MTKNNYVNTRICLTYRTILLPKIESGSRFKSEPGDSSSFANLELRTMSQLLYGSILALYCADCVWETGQNHLSSIPFVNEYKALYS